MARYDNLVTVAIAASWDGSGTETALSTASTTCLNSGTVGIQVVGSFTATLVPEYSIDGGTTWLTATVFPVGGGAGVTSLTAAGAWRFGTAGLSNFRVRCSAFTSSPTVTLSLSASQTPDGSGVSGATAVTKTVAVTTSGAGYVAGDVVGGIISLTTANYATTRNVILHALQVSFAANIAPALQIYFFNATPSGGTYTDNSALVWGAGDSAKKVGQISVLAADYLSANNQQSVNYSGLDMMMDIAATTLFVLVVAQGSYTIANGEMGLKFNLEQL